MTQLTTEDVRLSIIDAIHRLPLEVTDIAKFLLAQRIKGKRNSIAFCPLANYFNKTCVLGGRQVQVHSCSVHTYCHGFSSMAQVKVGLPDGVAEFYSMFDQGVFPALEENEP